MPPQKTVDRQLRLNAAVLAACGQRATVPGYRLEEPGVGIVHLGLGAFHRAHQAVYTDRAIARFGGDWKIVGVSLRSGTVRDQLNPQDGLYTLAELKDRGTDYQVIGSIERVLVAPEDPNAVLDAMCAEACKIVSLTVTEKGYCHDPATGKLNVEHPDIRRDRAEPARPVTALGFIVESLATRREQRLPIPTILCCDNLPSNGDTLRGLVTEFAALRDAELAEWISANVPFPNSMVDRIVPATQPEDLERLSESCGYLDAGMIKAESFSQWVIEDRFASGRPRWEAVGVDVVVDVAPFEIAKLRLLNGAHSAVAYLGYLAGYRYVHEVMEDAVFRAYLRELMHGEIIPTLTKPEGVELTGYADDLLERFANPALQHKLHQIAMDGSQKIPQRWLGTVRDRLEAGATIDGLSLAIAGWVRYVMGYDEKGIAIDVQDPFAAAFEQIERDSIADQLVDAERLVDRIFDLDAVFGAGIGRNRLLKSRVVHWLGQLMVNGVSTTLKLRHFFSSSTDSGRADSS